MTRGKAPNLKHEQSWFERECLFVAGSDEVGRGSLGGPVTVGIVVVDETTKRPPTGLRDSKLLTPLAREALVPRIKRWAADWAIGHASAAEIDAYGILRALRLAGERALSALQCVPDVVVLDGNYDWYSRPDGVFESPFNLMSAVVTKCPPVEIKLKADLTCASVAAASVIAKVERDQLMVKLSEQYPEYGWHENKGYSCASHAEALRTFGPCEEHRRSWSLLGGSLDEALIS